MFFFSSRRRHTRLVSDWSSDVCSSDLHFEVRSLPPSTYEIVVDEPGYEPAQASAQLDGRSEERRVGKECRYRWSPDHYKKKTRQNIARPRANNSAERAALSRRRRRAGK